MNYGLERETPDYGASDVGADDRFYFTPFALYYFTHADDRRAAIGGHYSWRRFISHAASCSLFAMSRSRQPAGSAQLRQPAPG